MADRSRTDSPSGAPERGARGAEAGSPGAPDAAAFTRDRAAGGAAPEAEGLFRLLVASVRDYAIFALDPEGRVASWNAGAERIKGYTAGEILGRHFSTFYPAEDAQRGKPQRELEVAAAEGRLEDEGWRVRKDGTRFWANVVITALRNAEGELVGFAKVTRDLTERRAAQERALADARRMAEVEAANRVKTEFLTAMSHELRTPLNAIAGYVQLLELGIHGPTTERQRATLERIARSGRHLLSLINDVLNYARLEAGRVEYDLRPTLVADVMTEIAPMIEPQMAAKGLALEVRLPEGRGRAPILVRADREKLGQILLNLLSNAAKFTQAGGRVTVELADTPDGAGMAVLRVADTGVGIPADKLEQVFEPFVQLERTLTTAHQGTGLGLAISRDLARGMGGDLTAESTVGAGSTFTLVLPAA